MRAFKLCSVLIDTYSPDKTSANLLTSPCLALSPHSAKGPQMFPGYNCDPGCLASVTRAGWGRVWLGNKLARHPSYSSRTQGIDGTEVQVAAEQLQGLLRCFSLEFDHLHRERIGHIIRLASALPNCDPLVPYYTSHPATVYQTLRELCSDLLDNCDSRLCRPVMVRLRERLARWAQFKPVLSLSEELIQAVDVGLQCVIVDMEAQRP